MKQLKVERDPKTGRLNIKGLAIWSTGTFHGYGSPAEGDTFTADDLAAMAKAHEEIGSKIRPRVYPGHKLNPLLKILARPKGEIVRLYSDGEFLYADIDGVDPTFWNKATEDGARFSPDVKFGYVDPKTGKKYDKLIVGLGVLGAAHPANPELPPLDEYVTNYYAAAYGDSKVRSYVSAPANMTESQREKAKDVPASVYLDPENKKYPVKREKDGEWVYSLDDLKDAYRLATMHGKNEIAEKAKGIMKREFDYAVGEDTTDSNEGTEAAYASPEEEIEEEVMDPKEKDAVQTANDERIGDIEEKLSSYAAALETERAAREKAEQEAAEARALAEQAAAVLEAQMVEREIESVHQFVDGLVGEMRLPPAAAEPVKNLLIAAAGAGGKVSSYALADLGEAGEKTLYDLAKEAFAALPAKEGTTKKDAKAAAEAIGGTGVDMRAYAYDPEAAKAVRERVDAYRKEHPEVSYADALKAVVNADLG